MAKNFLLYGRNVFKEAVAVNAPISEIYYLNDSSREFAEQILNGKKPSGSMKNGIPTELKDESHQGIAFRTSHDFYLKGWDWEQKDNFRFILLCNHIQDVHNLGAISRSAAAFGVDLIVHEERRSVRLNAGAIKVSAGQAFRMKFLEVSNLTPFCKGLKDRDYSIIGLEKSDNSVSIWEWPVNFPLALVVGGESEGISKPMHSQIDFSVEVPAKFEVESLNATGAATVAMSWVYKHLQVEAGLKKKA